MASASASAPAASSGPSAAAPAAPSGSSASDAAAAAGSTAASPAVGSALETVLRRLASTPNPDVDDYRILFHEVVLSNPDPNQDDLVFFVRQSPPSASPAASPSLTPSSSGTSLPGGGGGGGGGGGNAGRGEGGRGKAGDKGAPSDDIIFVKRRSKDHTVVLTPEEEANVRWKETLYLNVIVQLHCELTVAVCTKSVHPDGRSSMHALKYTTKRVYASPSKTRMDKKGHEYSYSFPLIFFNVEDFEDAFSSTVIGENEYLRVELRVRLPPSEGSLTGHDRHIVIFQGAVAWDAINSTFQKQTTAKSIWERVEYIMMRGPRAKGHCQVAVSVTDEAATANGAASGGGSPGGSRSASGTLRGFVRMAQQFAAKITEQPLEIKQLKCCLTFVNVSWQSIVNDVSTILLGPKTVLVTEDAPAAL